MTRSFFCSLFAAKTHFVAVKSNAVTTSVSKMRHALLLIVMVLSNRTKLTRLPSVL